MAKERNLDIFWLLGELDRKNYDLWNKLTEEQRKEFSPVLVLRWMLGSRDPVQLLLLNEVVNTVVFSLPHHKELLLKLLTVTTSGSSQRYQWLNLKTAGGKNKRSVQLIAEHYGLSLRDAAESFKLFSADEVLELAAMHGLQKDEIKELQKELG